MVNRVAAAVLVLALIAPGLFTPLSDNAIGAESGSIGLQVVPTASGELVVLDVVPGAPAAVAGLLPGDLIVKVDDFSLAGSVFAEVVPRHLWGEVGSSVTITYLRPGQSGSVVLTLRRAALEQNVAPPPGVKMLKPAN